MILYPLKNIFFSLIESFKSSSGLCLAWSNANVYTVNYAFREMNSKFLAFCLIIELSNRLSSMEWNATLSRNFWWLQNVFVLYVRAVSPPLARVSRSCLMSQNHILGTNAVRRLNHNKHQPSELKSINVPTILWTHLVKINKLIPFKEFYFRWEILTSLHLILRRRHQLRWFSLTHSSKKPW